MPRKKNVLPSYLLHKTSGQARVRINGRDHLLGPYGSEESRVKYGKLISQMAGGLLVDPLAAPTRSNRGTFHETNIEKPQVSSTKRTKNHDLQQEDGLSVAELLLAFKRHADSYYKTAERDAFNGAMRPVRELFAMLPAMDFSPLNLRVARQKFIDTGWCRGYCNKATNKVRHIWKWGVSHGLIPVATLQALQAVEPLKVGHTTAPDHKRREAVPADHLEAVREHLSQHYRDLFDVLRATGARPSELLGLTLVDIDTRGDVWIVDLTDHKNAHRGLSRKLFFGPQSQLILRRRPTTGKLFPFRQISRRLCPTA
jgi:integrase